MNEAVPKLERLLRTQMGRKRVFHVALAVEAADGSFSWSGAAGVADPDRNTAMRTDTPYFIASVTKLFTAAAILRFHERGLLRLDDPVARFVPAELLDGLHRFGGEHHEQDLEIHHLLGHTSGLADYFEEKGREGRTFVQVLLERGDADWTREALLARVRDEMKPKFAPAPREGSGQRAHYSDTNYQLLGAVLEQVAGKRFGAVLHDLLFAPLGLRDTYVFGDDVAGVEREAPATIHHGNRPFVIPRAMKAFGPNGGIVSTLADQVTFSKALFGGDVFEDPATLDRMRQWNKLFFPVEYGLGLMRYALPRVMSPFFPVPEFVGHSGSIGSFAFFCPEREFHVVGTVNQVKARSVPFQLMPRVANVLKGARTDRTRGPRARAS